MTQCWKPDERRGTQKTPSQHLRALSHGCSQTSNAYTSNAQSHSFVTNRVTQSGAEYMTHSGVSCLTEWASPCVPQWTRIQLFYSQFSPLSVPSHHPEAYWQIVHSLHLFPHMYGYRSTTFHCSLTRWQHSIRSFYTVATEGSGSHTLKHRPQLGDNQQSRVFHCEAFGRWGFQTSRKCTATHTLTALSVVSRHTLTWLLYGHKWVLPSKAFHYCVAWVTHAHTHGQTGDAQTSINWPLSPQLKRKFMYALSVAVKYCMYTVLDERVDRRVADLSHWVRSRFTKTTSQRLSWRWDRQTHQELQHYLRRIAMVYNETAKNSVHLWKRCTRSALVRNHAATNAKHNHKWVPPQRVFHFARSLKSLSWKAVHTPT